MPPKNDPPSQGSSQGVHLSQASQGTEEDTEWKLKDCSMEIVSVGKKDPIKDEFMTLDLVFKFPNNPIPQVVGKLLIWEAS